MLVQLIRLIEQQVAIIIIIILHVWNFFIEFERISLYIYDKIDAWKERERENKEEKKERKKESDMDKRIKSYKLESYR